MQLMIYLLRKMYFSFTQKVSIKISLKKEPPEEYNNLIYKN